MRDNLKTIDWTPVESSNIGGLFYDPATETICVRFHNGGLYSYIGINRELYMNLLHAPSVGKYLHNVVKAFPYTRWESESDLLDHLNV